MKRTGISTGKVILCGEYAMAFGHPGIAFPARETMRAVYRERLRGGFTVIFGRDAFHPEWAMYAGQVAEFVAHRTGMTLRGELMIETDLPLGQGMGSSTALVIAVSRALLGPHCRDIALMAEDFMNPGHSGMDFAVIWEGRPVVFRKGNAADPIELPRDLLRRLRLIDAGIPNEQTPALVAWVRSREQEVKSALETIGSCTGRFLAGEDIKLIFRDHHRAQMALGVVPPHAAMMITEIEKRGGAAKITGAGGRTGGGGMILAVR